MAHVAGQPGGTAAGGADISKLMGPGMEEYNLANVRAKAADVRRDVTEVEMALEGRAGMLKWDDVLKKFSVINAKMMALGETMRGNLANLVVFPCNLPELAVGEALKVQLASRLRPEQEEAEQAATDAVAARMLAGADTSTTSRAEEAQQQYGQLLQRAFEFDEFVASLAVKDGVLGPTGTGRKAVQKLNRSIEDKISKLQQDARAAAAATSAIGGAVKPRAPPPKRKREPVDPTILLALTGKVAATAQTVDRSRQAG